MSDFPFFAKAAFRNLWESKVTSLFTAITLSVALGFMGAYLAVFINLNAALGAVNEKFPLTVYVTDSASAAMLDAIKARLKSDPAVAGFEYISKERALKEFRESAKGEGQLLDSLSSNPLPASLDISLKASSGAAPAQKLVSDLRKMPGVEEVQYLQEEAGKLKAMLSSFKYAGMLLGLGVLLGVVFISYSTLRLAVLRHAEEIEVYKILGSTRMFIMGPFLFEGLFQGLIAASLSLAILYGLLRVLSGGLVMLPVPGVSFLPIWACVGMFAAGGLLGLTGSFFAFFRTLRM